MNENFLTCLNIVLKFEGGPVSHPQDPGGRTNKGITQSAYNTWRMRNKQPRADVFLISDKEVAGIYEHDYWHKIDGGQLPAGVDLAVFDFAVNSGVHQGRKMHAQARARHADPAAVIGHICDARLEFLRGLKGWRVFGHGWKRRVNDVRDLALAMAEKASGETEKKA